MADTEASKITETTIEEKKLKEKEKLTEKLPAEDEKTVENGDKNENKEEEEEDEVKESEEPTEPATDKCTIKRKSTGGDAVDGKDESTPEKKAKIDDAPSEEEANGEVKEAEATA
ncbi:hypothetical protein ABEB36_005811 [Hypothenemus hampei]|uniref:Uncharacterized protein n=1 Tax=Hypothenemus hampei TaxID=57062 RepID=A0ABD1EZI1_HYPHA